MRISGKRVHITSSDRVIRLKCPTSWAKLSEEQLRYALTLIGSNLYTDVEVRTLLLIRLCGIHVVKQHAGGSWSCWVMQDGRRTYFDLRSWQVQSMIMQLSFVSKPDDMDVRLESIQGFKAADKLLHGLLFIDYLNIEMCYQGYLSTKDSGRVAAMARILYRDSEGNMPETMDLDIAEQTNVLFWYAHVKKVMARHFPHFFRPVGGNGTVDGMKLLDQANAQMRALTDGDITKEEQVRQSDCWRALTELDARAREAEEFNRKYGNK
ncbi:MAG: hypothetical protein K5683_02760 [Prevotella sp.]|nr:hypothetical protein [Prevotella sp.]